MPVYADVLFVVNGFVNYLLLLCTMKILKYKTGRIRLLSGSLIGSLFSLKIFLPAFSTFVEFVLRIIFALIIVIVAFKFNTLKAFLKGFVAFFAVNFGFSGVIIALIYFFNPPNLLYDNGVIYYNISFLSLIILSTVSFAFLSIIEKILERKTDSQKIYEVTVSNYGKTVYGRGLLDTGNCLKEAFSGMPVIVADIGCIEKILPENIKAYLNNQSLDSLKPIRIIPVSTVSGTGLLPAFSADSVSIKGMNKKIIKDKVYIAVSKERFFHGEFEFLLNNDILEENSNAKNNNIFQNNTQKVKI